MRALENGVRIQYEYLFPTDQRWYEVQGYPSAEGVVLLFRDITDRKVHELYAAIQRAVAAVQPVLIMEQTPSPA